MVLKKRRRINTLVTFKPSLGEIIQTTFWDFFIARKSLNYEKVSSLYSEGVNHTQSIEYQELREIFKNYRIREGEVFVDIGCGAGRVISFWILNHFGGELYGIEIDAEVADYVKEWASKYAEIINDNVFNCLPNNASLLFMFNPFSRDDVFLNFISLIEREFKEIRIIYYHSKYVHLINDRENWNYETRSIYSRSRRHMIDCAYIHYKRLQP